jgi:N6-L-threonylcarbamoyladenine synthase
MTQKLALSIETSCDETALACLLFETDKNKSFTDYLNSVKVLGSVISSQIKIHAEYGGVVPEIGAREHAESIHILLDQLYKDIIRSNKESSHISIYRDLVTWLASLDYIFVTNEPGLPSALKVGVEFAKSLQFFLVENFNSKIEIVRINHLRGHVASCFYDLDEAINS